MSELWKQNINHSWAPTSSQVAEDPVGPTGYGRVAILVKRPRDTGNELTEENFRYETRTLPEDIHLEAGKVIVKVDYLSMDPTQMIWAQDIPQYMPACGLNTIMRSLGVGTIIKTSDEQNWPVGTVVSGMLGVVEFSLTDAAGLMRAIPDVPATWNIGPFHFIQGHTAWVGYKICNPKNSETMVVSGAAGAVGLLAAQLGKSQGARVIGVAGGSTKCKFLTEELGLDGAVDYKLGDVSAALKELCPNGIDCYFDNVGGSISEAVFDNANCGCRVAICGLISSYENKGAYGPRNYEMILHRRMTIQGFIAADYLASTPQSIAEIKGLLAEGKLKLKEDIREGKVDDYVNTIRNLFSGGNHGKLLLKLI